GISDKISLFKDAYLSSSTFFTGGYSATIHNLSPFHLSGCKVACKAPRSHGCNGPFSSSTIPIERIHRLLHLTAYRLLLISRTQAQRRMFSVVLLYLFRPNGQ